MNLIFRMLRVLITSWFKPRLLEDTPNNTLSMRVLPNDIDINLHMNNGRYLTICDLSRVDLFLRSGLAATMFRHGWMPVIAEHTMRYKRPLKLLQPYQVTMQVTGWDERAFHMLHQFIVDERVVAEGESRGCVVGKLGVIAPEKVVAAVRQQRAESQ